MDEERYIPVSDGGLAVPEVQSDYGREAARFPDFESDTDEPVEPSEFDHGLGEVPGDEPASWGLADEEVEEPETGADRMNLMAARLREAADLIESMGARDEFPVIDISADIKIMTETKEQFRAVALAIGGARKIASGDSFWLTRSFGEQYGKAPVEIDAWAPGREAVCEKRVVGTEEIEETLLVKTGRTIEREVYEWDCHSILAGTEVES